MEFTEFISQPYVIWFLIGIAFFLIELSMPGLIVMFFGIGSWATAIACLLFDIGLNAQLIIFISSSLLSLILLRKYFKKLFLGKKGMDVDDSTEEILGKVVVAESDIDKGKRGRVTFKGASWSAESNSPVKKGELVKIIGKESIVLKVEKNTED